MPILSTRTNYTKPDIPLNVVVGALSDAGTLLTKGLIVAGVSWNVTQKLTRTYKGIHDDFEPLVPVFESKTGFFELITSRSDMRLMVNITQRLLATSTVLEDVGNAFRICSNVLETLSTFFRSILDRLPASSSINATQLLGQLHFLDLSVKMADFSVRAESLARDFRYINDSYGPLLEHLEEDIGRRRLQNLTKEMASAGGNPGADFLQLSEGGEVEPDGLRADEELFDLGAELHRRLQLQAFTTKISEDQKVYANATRLFVPTWKATEDLSIDMCPWAYVSRESSDSLECRVKKFTQTSGDSAQLATIISTCTANPWDTDDPSTQHASNCPSMAFAADITDIMSENAESIGLAASVYENTPAWVYVLAVVAAVCGCVCMCGLGYKAYVMFKQA